MDRHVIIIPTCNEWENIAPRDVATGSRYVSGGGTLDCTAPRKALSWGANLFARAVLNLGQ